MYLINLTDQSKCLFGDRIKKTNKQKNTVNICRVHFMVMCCLKVTNQQLRMWRCIQGKHLLPSRNTQSLFLHTHLACYGCKITPHGIIGSRWWGTISAWIASIRAIPSLGWCCSHRPTHGPWHGAAHVCSWHPLGWHPWHTWHAWHLTPILR